MGKVVYITGGARSGKSSFAESYAANADTVTYIATGIATDDEMAARIEKHKQSRPSEWQTVESYRNIDATIKAGDTAMYLLDCLTVMITNIVMEVSTDGEDLTDEDMRKLEEQVTREVMNMVVAAKEGTSDLIVVSNEVGMGIVPEYKLARFFRDAAGRANQLMASLADEAYLLVSGIPLKIKG